MDNKEKKKSFFKNIAITALLGTSMGLGIACLAYNKILNKADEKKEELNMRMRSKLLNEESVPEDATNDEVFEAVMKQQSPVENTMGVEAFMEQAAEMAQVRHELQESFEGVLEVLAEELDKKDSIIAAKDSILEANGLLDTQEDKPKMLPMPGRLGF